MNRAIALDQLDTFRKRVHALDDADWTKESLCAGWDVTELVRHVTAVAWMQAEAFHRARVQMPEQPSWGTVNAAPADLPNLLDEAYDHLAPALAGVIDNDSMVPLPFAVMPAPLAVGVLILEYAVHLYDLRGAVDTDPHLDDDAAEVVAQLVPMWMPLAGTATDEGTSIALGETALRYVGTGWQPIDAEDATTSVMGDTEALSLFALGRIGPDDPRLTITGDTTVAKRFKELFPGP